MTSATANSVTLKLERDPATGFVTDSTLGTVTTATDYNGFGEPSLLRAAFQGAANFSEQLERDALGRITHISEKIGTRTRELDYEYDALGRLVEATENGVTTEYEYDANGNRTAVTIDGERTESEYDGQDRLLAFGGSDLEQTAQGDLLRISDGDNANELAYDALGNLLTVTQNRAGTTRVVSYKVDGFGRRVARQIDGKFDAAWFYRDALRPVGQLDAAGVFMHFIYTDDREGGAPDFILRAGVPYRVIKDHLGSVRLVVNAQTGVVEEQLDYDAFGHVTNDTNAGFQPFGFAGGLDDPFTGLVRFGRRDYASILGRWTAKDPIGFAGGDTNVYAYCGSDPVNRIDPRGENPLVLAVCAFGGCEAAAAAAATAATYVVATVGAAWAGIELGHWFAKKRDIRQIEEIIRRVGLDRAQRRRLHDEITRQGLELEEIERIAREIKESARRGSPRGGDRGGDEEGGDDEGWE